MNPAPDRGSELARALEQHLALCHEVLRVVEQEALRWRQPDPPEPFASAEAKKGLLPRLNQSLDELRQRRTQWRQLSRAERARHRDIPGLIQQNQELIMRIILLDRENEQTLLRQGLVPPRRLPSVNRQRPHYVASLYQRSGGGSGHAH